MSAKAFDLSIVTAESEIFTGKVVKLFVTGIQGELEIRRGHAPLLTSISPGPLFFENEDGAEEGMVLFGGMLEVQPHETIILGNAAMHSAELDEKAAQDAIAKAEASMAGSDGKVDYAKAHSDLMLALAQLRVIRKLRGIE